MQVLNGGSIPLETHCRSLPPFFFLDVQSYYRKFLEFKRQVSMQRLKRNNLKNKTKKETN
jgi:hypothetical protein